MIKIDDFRYKADDGNFIIRKADNFIMGEDICLGDADSIENYGEEPYTEESYKEFCEKYGVKNHELKEPKKDKKMKD